MLQSVLCVACAVVGGLFATRIALGVARRFGVVDHSDGKRKLHLAPVPLLGGVAVLAAAALALAMMPGTAFHWTFPWPLSSALLASACLACAVGCLDDIYSLRVRWKLLGQVLATLPLVLAGHLIERLQLSSFQVELGMWSAPVTVFWLVGGMNALNFLDGLDGLASTIAIVVCAGTALVAQHLGHIAESNWCLALAGSLVGFLYWNRPPARIYLGDAGSMVLGLCTACLAVKGSILPGGFVNPAVTSALLLVPLLDVALAVVRRSLLGQWIWIADRGHVHHRLLERNLSTWQILLVLGGLGLLTSLAAFSAVAFHTGWLSAGALLLVVTGLVRGGWCGHFEWGLFKQAVLGKLLGALSWLVSRRVLSALPTAEELSKSTFDAAWQQLGVALQDRAVLRLEVTVGARGDFGWRQAWGARLHQTATPHIWTLDILYESQSGGWCKLRALVAEHPAAHPVTWLTLVQILRRFGEHWAAHPVQMPMQRLRIVNADEVSGRGDTGGPQSEAA